MEALFVLLIIGTMFFGIVGVIAFAAGLIDLGQPFARNAGLVLLAGLISIGFAIGGIFGCVDITNRSKIQAHQHIKQVCGERPQHVVPQDGQFIFTCGNSPIIHVATYIA